MGSNGKWVFRLEQGENAIPAMDLCQSTLSPAAVTPAAETRWLGQDTLEIEALSPSEWESLSATIEEEKKLAEDSVAVARDMAAYLCLSGVQSLRADHPARDNLVNGTYELVAGKLHHNRPFYRQVPLHILAPGLIIKY